MVREDGQTELTLLDGQVDLTNEQGSLQLQSGEQATVAKGQAPRKTAVINAVNIIQWTLYYPAILDPDELEMPADLQTTLAASLLAYRSGDLLQALAQYPATAIPCSDTGTGLSRRPAAGGGRSGSSPGSVAQLHERSASPRPGRRAAGNDRHRQRRAFHQHRPARPSPPNGWPVPTPRNPSATWPTPLTWRGSAAAKSPHFGFAQERVAEMEFSFGHTEPALDALQQSLAVSPRNAQALALQGFVLSAQNKIDPARACFEQAIAADGSLANGWLGRGLTKIRTGDVDGGRQDWKPPPPWNRPAPSCAATWARPGAWTSLSNTAGIPTWPPTNWAGPCALDPNDPTAWLYAALLDDQHDAINQAIADLEHSQDLNANRALFRSKFLLDQDQAVRSANLALIYQDAGLTDVAVREGTRAVEDDYANYAAHLFLSDSYYALLDPQKSNLRYESAWQNELLLADLLAPVGAGVLSGNVSQQEYSRTV